MESVRVQLEDIVTRLVRTHIATPNNRLAKGLSRAGHIDISAHDTAEGLDISVECEGEIVSLLPKRKDLASKVKTSIDMNMEIGA